MAGPVDLARLRSLVRDVPDFPAPGVTFRDVTPLLADHGAFVSVIDAFADFVADEPIDVVVGIESRGFILAAPVAYRFGAGFVPARKAGKLPAARRSVSYELEYGTEVLELHEDAVRPGDHVLVVDDVLATGGTAAAAIDLVEQLGGRIAGLAFLIELTDLGGVARLDGRRHTSLLEY